MTQRKREIRSENSRSKREKETSGWLDLIGRTLGRTNPKTEKQRGQKDGKKQSTDFSRGRK